MRTKNDNKQIRNAVDDSRRMRSRTIPARRLTRERRLVRPAHRRRVSELAERDGRDDTDDHDPTSARRPPPSADSPRGGVAAARGAVIVDDSVGEAPLARP